MPKFKTDMLIRDKRLEWMKEQGIEVDFGEVGQTEMPQALRTKLLEKATETALEENPLQLMGEMADMYEVMIALAKLHGLSETDVAEHIKKKREEMGQFDQRIHSYSVTLPEGHAAEPYYREHPEKYPEIKDE